MDNYEDIAGMTGQRGSQNAPKLVLDELSIAGHRKLGGMFRVTRMTLPKDPETGFHRTEETQKGDPIQVVFLKIRRKLVEKGKEVGKDGVERFPVKRLTSEHNRPSDIVSIYELATKKEEFARADNARERYPGFRTNQIVYVRYAGKVCRLIVKGSALGSKVKAEGQKDFYEYLASFGDDEHMFQYFTILRPVFEEGSNDYWTIRFERGERLTDEQIAVAAQNIREIHAFTEKSDAFIKEKAISSGAMPVVRPSETRKDLEKQADEAFAAISDDGVDYPTAEDEEIPF